MKTRMHITFILHQLANNLPLLINFNNLLGENYAK